LALRDFYKIEPFKLVDALAVAKASVVFSINMILPDRPYFFAQLSQFIDQMVPPND